MRRCKLRVQAMMMSLAAAIGCTGSYETPANTAPATDIVPIATEGMDQPSQLGPDQADTPHVICETVRLHSSDSDPYDHFGSHLAVNDTCLVAGAPGDDAAGIDAGAAYVFVHEDGIWKQSAKLVGTDTGAHDRFGHSIGVHNGTVVVGSPCHDARGQDSGAAYVFRQQNGKWRQVAKLISSDAAAGLRFGQAVVVQDNSYVVGAIGKDSAAEDSGGVYVFTESGDEWQETQIMAQQPLAHELFGFAVDLDDDTLVVGAYGNGQQAPYGGAAYVFRRDGQTWTQVAQLVCSDSVESLAEFGSAISIDDDVVVVGARGCSDKGPRSGAAYVFEDKSSGWEVTSKLSASDGAFGDAFGESVSLSGDIIVIGAHFRGDVGVGSGAAYLFTRRGNGWVESAKLMDSDATGNSEFGSAIAISPKFVAVGVLRDSGTESGELKTACGACYLFDLGSNAIQDRLSQPTSM